MISTMGVRFYEGDIQVRTLYGDAENLEAYRLRHKVFSERLQWVEPSLEGLEKDPYDTWATSIGLFHRWGKLIGISRLLPTTGPFMLENEFQSLLQPRCTLRKRSDTAEITRMTIDPSITDKGLSKRILKTLLKGIYQWSVQNDVRYLYMVVEKRFFRVLRAIGFPCEPISACKSLPPAGALSVAAILDLEQFRVVSRRKRPWFLDWISTVEENNSSELKLSPLWEANTSADLGWIAGIGDRRFAESGGRKTLGRM